MSASCHALIDQTYDCFVSRLPASLVGVARQLPRRCGLTPLEDVPWSMVFNNIAVLGFPALLFFETHHAVDAKVLGASARVHLFAMITAFAEDRIADGQIEADDTLLALLVKIAEEREQALAELTARGAVIEQDFTEARASSEGAAVDEQAIFEGRATGNWARYIEVSRAKQSLAFPAALAGASAAGFDVNELESVRELLFGCTLGLQYRDDVVDWLDDHRAGGAWAVVLLGEGSDASEAELAARLHERGVLVAMLERSRDEFAKAARAALELGATSLGRWAAGQAAATAKLARGEAAASGHALEWERARVASRTNGQAAPVQKAS